MKMYRVCKGERLSIKEVEVTRVTPKFVTHIDFGSEQKEARESSVVAFFETLEDAKKYLREHIVSEMNKKQSEIELLIDALAELNSQPKIDS